MIVEAKNTRTAKKISSQSVLRIMRFLGSGKKRLSFSLGGRGQNEYPTARELQRALSMVPKSDILMHVENQAREELWKVMPKSLAVQSGPRGSRRVVLTATRLYSVESKRNAPLLTDGDARVKEALKPPPQRILKGLPFSNKLLFLNCLNT